MHLRMKLGFRIMKCKKTYHILELYDEIFSILVISTVPWLYIMILKFIITLFFTDWTMVTFPQLSWLLKRLLKIQRLLTVQRLFIESSVKIILSGRGSGMSLCGVWTPKEGLHLTQPSPSGYALRKRRGFFNGTFRTCSVLRLLRIAPVTRRSRGSCPLLICSSRLHTHASAE